MKISGSSTLEAPVDKVWEAILDPAVLARCIPGCESLSAVGEDRYAMSVTAGVAAIKGTYAGEVSLADLVAPHSLTMKASGAGAPGTIDADVKVRLAPVGRRRHRAHLRRRRLGRRRDRRRRPADARRRHARRWPASSSRRSTATSPVAAAPAVPEPSAAGASGGAGRRPAAAPVYAGRNATATANLGLDSGAGFAVGVLVGGILALAGVALGRPDREEVLMRAFTAAAVQVAPVPGPLTAASVQANLDKLVAMTRRCVEATGAELVVLPESATTGFTPGIPTAELWELMSELPGPVVAPLVDVAAELGIHLVVGTYERGPTPDVIYNSSVLVDPAGEVLGVYRKTHPFYSEGVGGGGWVTPGDTVAVCDTELGRIGMIICFDGDYPELLPHPGGAGRRGHLPAVGPAALGRHLGAHLTRPGLRQPRVRRRGECRGAGPRGRPLLRQLAHRDPDRPHRREGRDARGVGLGAARPRGGAVVAHARARTSGRGSTTCATATSTSSATTGRTSRARRRRRSPTPDPGPQARRRRADGSGGDGPADPAGGRRHLDRPVPEPSQQLGAQRRAPVVVEDPDEVTGRPDAREERGPVVAERREPHRDLEHAAGQVPEPCTGEQRLEAAGLRRTGQRLVDGPGTGVDRRGGVPEGAQHRHPSPVVPHGGAHDAARPGRATHLGDTHRGVGEEVQDEQRQGRVDRPRGLGELHGRPDEDAGPARCQALPGGGDERR